MNDIIFAMVKAAIIIALNQPEDYDLDNALKAHPVLAKDGTGFVTINTKPNEQLRGCIGIQAMILAAKKLKLSSKLLDYCTSAETSKDTHSVVGYISAIFYT